MESFENVSPVNTPLIKWGWLRAILILPVWIMTMVVITLIAFLGFGVENEDAMYQLLNTPAGVIVMFLQLVGTVIPIVLYRKFIDRRSFVSLGLQLNRQYAKDLLAGMLWGIGLITVVFATINLFGGLVITGISWPSFSLLFVTVVMILVAISEELMVRGYLLNNFMTSVDKYAALLITSLIFSAGHLLNPNTSWLGLLNIVLAGLLLGLYYVHRQNLWFPIGLHFSWNLFQGSFFGSQVSGVSLDSVIAIETTGSDLLTGGSFGFEASLVTTAAIVLAGILIHLIYRPGTATGA